MTYQLNKLPPAYQGAALMIGAGLLFAAVNTSVQWATMRLGVPSASVAFWQYLVAFLFYIPWLVSRRGMAFGTQRFGLHVLRVALAAVGVQLWVMGLAHVPIWQAIALIMLSPFFVALGAGVLLGEAATWARWAAVSTGFVGGMIVLAPWSDAFSLYALLPVAAALFWAGASLMTKYMTRTESAETLTAYLLLLLIPVNGVALVGQGAAWPGAALGVIVVAGVLTALAQFALAKAYSTADASYLQPFDHLKLPFNVALGLAVFGFVPPGSLWAGSTLIIAASFFLMRVEARVRQAAAV